MHCPNCGTRFSTEQKFCRSCGLGLQPIAQLTSQLLAENASASPAPPEGAHRTSTTAWNASRWSAWLSFLGVFVFLCGLLLFTLNHVLKIDRVIDVPAAFACLLGTLIALYGVLFPRLHAPKRLRSLASVTELPAATTNDLGVLPGTMPDSSIVEHTTRHLEPIIAEPDQRRNH